MNNRASTPRRWSRAPSRRGCPLRRGDVDVAGWRRHLNDGVVDRVTSVDNACESAQRGAELALWARRPGFSEVRRALLLFTTSDLTILCGRLLAAGMRACGDLADRARARGDPAANAAKAAAESLA